MGSLKLVGDSGVYDGVSNSRCPRQQRSAIFIYYFDFFVRLIHHILTSRQEGTVSMTADAMISRLTGRRGLA
jgi:hypothetical protein